MIMRGRLSSRATVQGDIYRSGGGGGSSVEPNPTGEINDTLKTIGIDGLIYNIEGIEKAEIIPITQGNGTTTRKFIFSKKPKFIAYHFNDPILDGSGWNTTAHFIWGQSFIVYTSSTNVVAISNNYQGCLSAVYDDVENSVTFTGGNAFSACNTPTGTGLMFVYY